LTWACKQQECIKRQTICWKSVSLWGESRVCQSYTHHLKSLIVSEKELYLTALAKVPHVGPITGRQLVSYCGSPEAVFKTKKASLAKIPNVGYAIADNITNHSLVEEAAMELEQAYKSGARVVTYLDDDYPSRLKYFEESPLLLYIKGNPELNPQRTVGIIGTRMPTPQGRYITERIVQDLKEYEVTIISGMAHGIDSYAHTAALQEEVPTIGILGHGFHTMYPAAHRALARQMAGKNGLMTEFNYHAKPDRENFPMRNRVIAAFSDALIVIESKEKGGSMITAEFANRFNKDVFAVPGRPYEPTSKGCNMLIKSNKAHLLEDATDLIATLRWEPAHCRSTRLVAPELFQEITEEGKTLLEALKLHSDMGIDELGYMLRMRPSALAALLMDLEFKGIVKPLPGKRYTLAPYVSY
jgi:DNA processing protein